MARKEIKVGDRITIGTEFQWWNSDDTNVDYISDRWCPYEVAGIVTADDDWATLDLISRDGIWEREVQLELEWADIELVK